MRILLTLGSLLYLGPIFGLIGTVIGVIQSFQAIADQGTADAQVLAESVQTALITTQLGLMALPFGVIALILGHVLKFWNEPVNGAIKDSDKSYGTCAALNLLLGFIGAHHFYSGRTGLGIFYALSLGGFVVGKYCDFIRLAWGSFTDSEGNRIRFKRQPAQSVN
ncbi:MAG: MotA/TolQ/ExbB proton channel family protein [Verrucomicrobiota bacterium]